MISFEEPQARTRPILRWAGSKQKLLPYLVACAPKSFDRYLEPFAGSASFFAALRPRAAVLSDFNLDLMETYRILRRYPAAVAKIVLGMPRSSVFYYRLRAEDTSRMTSQYRAARFIYLNRFCFNGVYRTNKKGMFNVPRGSKVGNLPSLVEFMQFGKALRAAELRSGDFEDCLHDLRPGDFVYLDPPYAKRPNHGCYGEYGYDCFGETDLERFHSIARRAATRGAVILISYTDNPTIRKMFRNWHLRPLTVMRHVAGFRQHRRTANELLISNRSLPSF